MSILELHGACDHTLCALMSRYAVFLIETCPKLMDTKKLFIILTSRMAQVTLSSLVCVREHVCACMCVCVCVCDFGDK